MSKFAALFLVLVCQVSTYCLASSLLANHAENSPACINLFSPHQLRICGLKKWYLIDNRITPGNDAIQFNVNAGVGMQTINILIDSKAKLKLNRTDNGFHGDIDISDLTPGGHSLTIAMDGSTKPELTWWFHRSHPYYALLTTDWDSSDSKDSVLKRHIQLHQEHPAIKITHFLGPYTFTDPQVPAKRKTYLAQWMLQLKATYQDEIGLHIHPFCNFVNTVPGVDCRFKPSDTYNKGDASGYTVLSAAYSESEFLRLLKAANNLFSKYGLGKPISFRTGSWAANPGTLQALAEDGFVADSSANNWLRIRNESEHDGNGELYRWNRANWRAINDLSQPYLPSHASPMQAGKPEIPILEVPDNGSLVDYVSAKEMIDIFKSNWGGEALSKPKTFVFGFHPVSYGNTFHKRIERTLYYIDRYLANHDSGPVVYETLSHMVNVFPASAH
jgi:hypothetical protein